MKKLHGVIEELNKDIVQGWVLPQNFNCPLEDIDLFVRFDNEIIGRGKPSKFRKEFGQSCGYAIKCDRPFPPESLLINQCSITACYREIKNNLTPTSTVRTQLLDTLIKTKLQDAKPSDVNLLIQTLGKLPAVATEEPHLKVNNPDRTAVQDILKSISGPRESKKEITYLPIEVGYISHDGSTLVGREGETFLVLGTNKLLRQFTVHYNDQASESLASEWVQLIGKRFGTLKNADIEFLQLIIPEKISVYPELFPGNVNTPSAILHNLEVQSQGMPYYISGYQALSSLKSSMRLYPRFDTHLTVPAAYHLFSFCLERFGLTSPFQLELSDETELTGDLSCRFFGFPLPETIQTLSPNTINAFSGSLEMIERVDDGNKHIGTRYVWRNEGAPYDLKVVAFANSFFERGGSPRTLTWWFQRAFREFHFIWSPDLDMSYVRKTCPDLIICQTIERFLGRLPNDNLL